MRLSKLWRFMGLLEVLGFLLAVSPSSYAAISASSPDRANSAGSGNSFAGVISSDGNIVVFLSEANDLVQTPDRSLFLNIFAREIDGGSTRFVSIKPDGSRGGNGNSIAPSISSNGQRIAFQ